MIEIEKICKKYGLSAKKSLGQNFLKNQEVLDLIVKTGEVGSDDSILEIGPGVGVLTERLLRHSGCVLAVELDERLVPILQGEFSRFSNFILWNKNILDISNAEIAENLGSNYKVIANIPYNITSPILRKFTEQEPRPQLCVFMVQKEVAQRVTACPGSMSILSVAIQFYTNVKYVQTVSANDFVPRPQVDSAIIQLAPRFDYLELLQEYELTIKQLFTVVRIGFSSRRKQLHNNLGAGLRLKNENVKVILNDLGLAENIRAQELKISEWILLVRRLHELFDVI